MYSIILNVLQWYLTNLNSLGPELVQIREIFRISETIHFELGAISVLFTAHHNEYE
jgi:hypothetical protein